MRSVVKALSIASLVAIIAIVALQVLAATSSTPSSGISRLPASLSLGFTTAESDEVKVADIEVIKLKCLESINQVNVGPNTALVRVTGQWCKLGKSVKANTSVMQNRATGLYATVFNMPTEQFSSDLITLAGGSNSLSITVQDQSGHAHLYQLEISRK